MVRTWSMCSTGMSSSSLRTFSGSSTISLALSFGRIKVLMPARWAASVFSFRPPIGSTLPRSVTSPVIATSRRTGRPVIAEISAVAQRRGDRFELIGCRDEHHLREVVRDLEVVVRERVVLLGVEHLEQRRRRVAPEILTDFIDLVEDVDRVARFGRLHALDDPSRQRADV